MDISLTGILFFVFIVFVVILPALRIRGLAVARQGSIRALEQKRGSRVIVLIHRQETVGLLGYPIFRYIDIEDSEQILRAIKLTDAEVPIDLILHTPGGLVLAAEQIAHAISRHPAKVTVFVPHYAMSGGTLLSLAADEIIMDENAVLGPVDPQLGGQPAASILAVLDQKAIDKIDDQTLILADMSRKAINQVKATVTEILEHHPNIDRPQAEKMATLLATGTWTHDYPISVEEAQEMGLPVSTDMPKEVYQLMDFYAQTQQKRPSVSYIPTPYQRPSTSKES
ncbi:MAG: ATP-dependent Clp protease proteolytic subunit [Anaerolineae bacterium]|nr:ATP-dependent Clp protease proteolytic subunit [Anaerolineae bacterium]